MVPRSKQRAPFSPSVLWMSIVLATVLTQRSAAQTECLGDCDGSGAVTVDELVTGVNLALESLPLSACPAFDGNGSGTVEVDELVVAVTNALTGCASAPGEIAQSAIERDHAPAVDTVALAELTRGNSAFAFDLYHAIGTAPGNLFYSPYSVSLAFAMLYAGSANGTARQMANTLHFTLPQETLHPALNALDLELSARGRGRQGADGKGFRLNIVNAVWGQRGYSFLPAYLDILAANYGAGLRLLDFGQMPDEATTQMINDWVSGETEGRIQDLIPAGAITPFTRLVLTNAIYFNAAWALAFPPEQTTSAAFYLKDGTPVTVSMMRKVSELRYAKRPGYQAIELPYDGNELSMLVLLPDAGHFDAFEAGLSGAFLDDLLPLLGHTNIDLTMPKFSYSQSFNLSQTLMDLGMPDAFSHLAADFSGIDGTRELAIDFVFHQAFVKVNEAGTEAAAATAIGVGITSIPPPPIEVRIDRPFIFLIRDHASGAILFIGRVLQPGE